MGSNGRVSYCVAVSDELLGDGAPVPFQGGLAAGFARAAELGFDSVELHIRNPASISPSTLDELCAAHGLRIAALGTGLEYSLNGNSFTSPDPQVRRTTFERFVQFIELAARCDAVVFLGLCRGRAPAYREVGAYLDLLAEELRPIAAFAAERRVSLGLEPIVFYLTNLLNTTSETLAFLARPAGSPTCTSPTATGATRAAAPSTTIWSPR